MIVTELELTLGALSLIPQGEGRSFEVAGERIAVFHMRSGEVFATQASCPHKQGPLADGLVGSGMVICPLHAWKFDLASGEPVVGDCRLQTYPVRIDEHAHIVVKLQVAQSKASAM